MRIVLTGASGFLGWHTRVRLRATTEHEVVPVTRANWAELEQLTATADAIIHVAGVNRAADDAAVELGNVALAQDVARAVAGSPRCRRVIYTNSTQAGNGSPYGSGKQRAAEILREATLQHGGTLVDIHLPNLFGEHGRPAYNSFVATFVHAASTGAVPTITDREVRLLHVQDAAAVLVDGLTGDHEAPVEPKGRALSVLGTYEKLRHFSNVYATGELPDLADPFDVSLFNTYRAALFPTAYPIRLTPRVDQRGQLVEVVRAGGGEGQTFVSTTRPGITRGEHFHLRKIERFAVLHGRARISLRRMFSDEVVHFDVSGDEPCAIDMPTLWAHNITNIGETDLTTVFWTNELFDPESPDTFAEPVTPVVP